jgi:hypothetical protein
MTEDLLAFEEGINSGRRTKWQTRDLIVNPEVARMLAIGMSRKAICEAIGVNPGTLARYINSLEMSELLEIETRRVVRHISRRDLSKEKYLALVTGVGVMIDKVRLLRNEPTTIQGRQGAAGVVNSITIALFGRGGVPEGEGVGPEAALDVTADARLLPEPPDGAAEADPGSSDVGDSEG